MIQLATIHPETGQRDLVVGLVPSDLVRLRDREPLLLELDDYVKDDPAASIDNVLLIAAPNVDELEHRILTLLGESNAPTIRAAFDQLRAEKRASARQARRQRRPRPPRPPAAPPV